MDGNVPPESGALRNPRIVIADDFETLRRGLRSLLGSAVCGEAKNGQEAIQRVLELRPNLVILDWTMPVMSGLEALKAIRSLAPETKILVFSLHSEDAVKEEALRAGADAFLHKTTTGDTILKTIAALLPGMSLLDSATHTQNARPSSTTASHKLGFANKS